MALALAEQLLSTFDDQAARTAPFMTNQDGAKTFIACRAGCSTCCRIEVSVSTSEMLVLHRAIQSLPDERRAEIRARVEAAYPQVRGSDAFGRRQMKIDCPLLTDAGECGVYEARPLACRSHVSFNLSACLADAESVDQPVPIPTSKTFTQHRDALRPRHREREQSLGLASGRYELIQALHIMLSRTDAGSRIARGEDVLRPARLS